MSWWSYVEAVCQRVSPSSISWSHRTSAIRMQELCGFFVVLSFFFMAWSSVSSLTIIPWKYVGRNKRWRWRNNRSATCSQEELILNKKPEKWIGNENQSRDTDVFDWCCSHSSVTFDETRDSRNCVQGERMSEVEPASFAPLFRRFQLPNSLTFIQISTPSNALKPSCFL